MNMREGKVRHLDGNPLRDLSRIRALHLLEGRVDLHPLCNARMK